MSFTASGSRPALRAVNGPDGTLAVAAAHSELGERYLYVEGRGELLFTENDTNEQRVFGRPNRSPYVKDAFHQYVVGGRREAVNPARTGTKAAAHLAIEVPARGERTLKLRLSAVPPDQAMKAFRGDVLGAHFDEVTVNRR